MDAILAALWQLADTPHTDRGRWFLIGALIVLLSGGVLLLVRGLIDLRRQKTETERTGKTSEDRKKAA